MLCVWRLELSTFHYFDFELDVDHFGRSLDVIGQLWIVVEQRSGRISLLYCEAGTFELGGFALQNVTGRCVYQALVG